MTDLSDLHEAAARAGAVEIGSRLGCKMHGNHRRARSSCPICGGHNREQFAIDVKDGRIVAHCWSCQFGGDLIALVGAVRGLLDFRAQLDATVELLSMAPIPETTHEQQPEAPRIDAISYHNVVTALIGECRKCRPIPDVARYLRARGILEIAPEYGLFPLPSCEQQRRIIAALLEQFELETLVVAGVAWRTNDGQIRRDVLSFARNRLCIPWRSPTGRIEALQRRVLDSSSPRYVFPKGIKAPHPFGIDKLKGAPKDRPVAFCEGALDAIALAVICRRENYNIVPLGLPGVDGWRESYADLCSGRRVYLAFDNDDAGTNAFANLAPQLCAAGVAEIHRWQPEFGKDWGDTLIRAAS